MPALLLLFTLLFGAISTAQAESQTTFTPYQTLLKRHVIEHSLPNNGLVTAFDYRSAQQHADTTGLLTQQDSLLASFRIDTLAQRDAAIAFWINAYNYFMISHILRDPGNGKLVSSVKDYGPFYQPYRVFQQKLFNVGGKRYSLDAIEKGILLGPEYQAKGWKDARVHFAVNCASVGCPPLRNQLYTAENLDALLTENTRRALLTPRHLALTQGELHVTQLFEWYEQDFVAQARTVKAYIKQYAPADLHGAIDSATRIRFIPYDWQLNRPENFPDLPSAKR